MEVLLLSAYDADSQGAKNAWESAADATIRYRTRQTADVTFTPEERSRQKLERKRKA